VQNRDASAPKRPNLAKSLYVCEAQFSYMKNALSLILVFLGLSLSPQLDRLSFYKAFESDSQSQMDKALNALKAERPSHTRDAYTGALTMKKAQFMSTPKEKALVFKDGRDMLEAMIKKDPSNTEYRFLRLAIQENVPKILKYSGQIEEDKKHIIKHYKSLDATLRKIIREYAAQSTHLSTADLK
jgi:hypothetical protein